jgi:DNA-binding CsgD family transcriptional regulator
MDGDELLAAAGTALIGRAWGDARELFERALEVEETAEALEGFAAASWWLDDVDAAITARERAYVLRRERGETLEAARVAGFLAWDFGAMRGATAVATGWLQRARRLIADLPASPEQAWLPLIEASFHLDTDPSEVLRLSTEAAEQAQALGGLDIEMTALTLQGLALVSLGRVAEGTRLLDEGTAAATAGELYDPIAIGSCCCNMIIACERARDFDRAGQWCEQLAAYCDRTGQRPLLALCRAHHGTVLSVRGEWEEAETELEWAAGELSTLRPPLAGYARARLAQLRRRQGRFGEARELLAQAAGHVLVPLVLSELALDDNDPSAAVGHAERYLAGIGSEGTIEAAAALEVLVPARIRLGDHLKAREDHGMLARIADAVGTPAVRAAERAAAGALALADGDRDVAGRRLEDAVELYGKAVAPYDAASARLVLARSLGAQDRTEAALEHALAGAAVFERLGAARAARTAAKLVTELGGRSAAARSAGLTAREVQVLRLVAEGLSNREAAERLVVSEHTVHRHLANVYAKFGVSSRAAAVSLAAQRELLG